MLDIVFTSDTAPKKRVFFGYGFQGPDFIVGHEGFSEFTASGRVFESDTDGCYLLVQPHSDGSAVFSTDFHGYFPLFYYRGVNAWIISPSFEIVAAEAHRRKLPLTVRKHQLDAWKSNAPLLQSPTSDRTPFEEIRLLSYDQEIIAGSKLTIRQKERRPTHLSYELALTDLLALWGGRIMTLLEGGMAIRVDVTGGVDSRTVLAVLLHTLQMSDRCDLLHTDSIFFNSHPAMTADFEIACRIGEAFRFPVNNPNRRKYTLLNDDEAFATWKRYNLARYSPHILPVATQQSNIITFNGIGGEEHRNFYEKFGRGPLGSYIAAYQQFFPDLKSFGTWMGDLHSDIDLPVPSYDFHIPAAVRHYRRHRGRHHTAKQPTTEFMGVILGSRSAYECTRFLDRSALEANQLLFDIMINCSEALARMPYDRPEKAPLQINFDQLTKLPKIEPVQVGRVWRKAAVSPAPIKAQGRNIPLRVAVDAALKLPEVRALAGDATLQKLQQQLAKLTPTNNLHQEGHLLHYILLAEVVSKYRTDQHKTEPATEPTVKV